MLCLSILLGQILTDGLLAMDQNKKTRSLLFLDVLRSIRDPLDANCASVRRLIYIEDLN